MNNKGFTLIELLATIIVLSIIAGITFGLVGGSFSKAKEETENVFVDTIKDAMSIYLSSDAKKLGFTVVTDASGNDCLLSKTHGTVKVEKATISMKDVIDSTYHPITQEDLINPANEEVESANAADIVVNIYRDEDFVYYYSIKKDEFNKTTGVNFFLNMTDEYISTLPEEFSCR